MAIANKFIHFNTKAGFLNKLSEYVTYDESANTYTVKEGKQTDWNMFKNYTCFIKDTSEIWTHEQFYDAPATSNPKPLGLNSAVGTSLRYAREDHVHMAPSSISGNAGSASKLLTARTISLTGDATGSTTFDGSKNASITVAVNNDSHNHSENSISGIYESKIKWDNPTTVIKSGSIISPIDTTLIPELAANRFAGMSNGITYEYSRDNGETWLPYSDTDAALITKKLFNEMRDTTNVNPGLMLKVGNYKSSDAGTLTSDTAWRSRITINFKEAGVYYQLRKFAIYYSTNYGKNSTVSIEGSTLSNPTVFTEFITDVPIAGQSSWNTINVNPFTTATQDTHTLYYQFLRITFKFNGISDPTKNQVPEVYWIGAYGVIGWTSASTVGKTGFPYIIHSGKEVDFDLYNIKSSKLITKNGTNNQVVLGDGNLKPISEIQNTASQLTIASGYDAKIILDNTDNEGAVSYISFRKKGIEITNLGINSVSDNNLKINGYTIWHSGNDGSKSGLDADTLDGRHLSEITLSANNITSGTIAAERLPEIPIDKIPAAALERLYIAATETAAMALTVEEGDVVQVTGNSNKMYFCISATATTFANKFKEFTAGTAASVPWSGITNKPSWIGTNKPTYNGGEIKLTGYTTNNINSISADSTVNNAIAELDTYAISSITDKSGLNDNNKYVMQSLETGHGSLSLYTNKGIIDTYDQTIVPVDVHNDVDRTIELQDKILVFTVDGEIQNGPSFNEDNTTYLDGWGQFTTPPDTKDYPTSLTWTNGTTAGPIGKLVGTNMTTVTFPAIPAASASNSGVITTGDQIFNGDKTFNGYLTGNNATIKETIITERINNDTNSNAWFTACNYGWGLVNLKQTGEIISAVTMESKADSSNNNLQSHYTLCANSTHLILGGYKGPLRDYSSNKNWIDGAIAISLDDTSSDLANSTYDSAKWRLIGMSGYSTNPKWSINQDGYFTGTSQTTKAYSLTHKTFPNSVDISAGFAYNFTQTSGTINISTISGFSELTPDAQVISLVKLNITATNAIKIQGLSDITGDYYIYNFTYMPNGKVAISGAGFTN